LQHQHPAQGRHSPAGAMFAKLILNQLGFAPKLAKGFSPIKSLWNETPIDTSIN
jgi:hypothetical protein